MAAILKLIQREALGGAMTSLDLLAFASGFDLEWPAWVPKVTDGSDKPVKEVIPLLVRGSSRDTRADCINLIDDMIRYRRQSSSEVDKYGVWLQVQMDGEPAARRAFLKDLTYEYEGSPYEGAASDGYYYQKLSLVATRMPLWEDDTLVLYSGITNVNCVGGTFDYTTDGGSPGAVTGTDPARLALICLLGASGGGGPINKFWCGFRTNRFYDRTYFQPYWSLRKSVLFDTDTTGGTSHADATAKDGYKTITTFATVATLKRRATCRVEDVTTNYISQRGSYCILLRAKLSGSGVVRMRLADGIYNGYEMSGRVQSRVPITSTTWQLYELGSVKIPTPGKITYSGAGQMRSYAMGIDAERVSGSCNLEMDCIVLIPNGEGFFYTDGGTVMYTGDNWMYLFDQPDNTKDSIAFSNGIVCNIGAPVINSGLPIGNGILVLAGMCQAISVVGDYINMELWIYRRWRAERGVV